MGSFSNIILAADFLSITNSILSIAIIIIGIGFLIFIHEFGHFLLAKLEKVRVEAFAIGFGPALINKKWGETNYRVNLIPLGGYVKMAGEVPGEGCTGAPDEFFSKRVGQRARILVAGVLMNGLFGIIGTIIAFQIGVRFISPKIGMVIPGQPAWESGLKEGDTIISIDGEETASFSDVGITIAFSDLKKGVEVVYEREGKQNTVLIFPRYSPIAGFPHIGILPPRSREIKVSEDSPAYAAGLRSGDVIIKIDDEEIKNGYNIQDILENKGANPATITVLRNGKEMSFKITPRLESIYRIGISPLMTEIEDMKKECLAKRLGFEVGDRLVEIDGKPIKSQEDMMILSELANKDTEKEFKVSLLRQENGKETKKILSVPLMQGDDFFSGVYMKYQPIIGRVEHDYPAYTKGLAPGDRIIAINGVKIVEWKDILGFIMKGDPIKFTYARDGQEKTIEIAPREDKKAIFDIGISIELTSPKRFGIIDSCKYGFIHTKKMVMQIFGFLEKLFTKQVAAKNIGGPISIFVTSQTYLEFGLGAFIYFMAIISVNLAILNLFPIPILDGFHLFMLGVEKIKGSRVSDRLQIILNYIGFVALILLVIYVVYHDIQRLS